MILQYGAYVLALTADDSLYLWKDKKDDDNDPYSLSPYDFIDPRLIASSVKALKLCPRYGRPLVLMQDGRVLTDVNLLSGLTFEDITAQLCCTLKGPDLMFPHAYRTKVTIQDVHVCGGMIVTVADDRISFTKMSYNVFSNIQFNRMTPSFIAFKDGINYSSFGYTHGYVRTNDNSLYSFGYLRPYNQDYPKVRDHPELAAITAFKLVDIADAENINQIICKTHYSFFIMNDGSVRSRSLTDRRWDDRDTDGPLRQIDIPAGVCIAKIIAKRSHIFYITTEGLCYYSYSRAVGRGCPYSASRPVLIKALAGCFVENVAATRNGAIVQYDEAGKLCLLQTTYPTGNGGLQINGPIDPAYAEGTVSPVPLPFPEDVKIVSVTPADNWVYFTTDRGRVYRHSHRWHLDTDKLGTRKVAFFSENPVAVGSSAARIRSGRSCLDD